MVWPEDEVRLGSQVVLFMHFDGRGFVRRQLIDYMRELKESGRDIVFVSNSEKLDPAALEMVKAQCAAVLIRRNIGYDFGAWADALHHVGLPRADTQEIIFANESVFGPLLPLNPTADLWRQLLMSGFPFIKRELLRENPTKVQDVGDPSEVVEGVLGVTLSRFGRICA